jgi:hypothetical protein
MSAKAGFFVVLFVLLIGVSKPAAESFASAQIRATATVVMPFGFIDNISEPSGDNANGPDLAIIDICHQKNTGIIVTANGDNGIIKQYRFPTHADGNKSEENSKADSKSISLERAILFRDDYFLQNSLLITLIYSEN